MSLETTATIETFGEEQYHRLYIPKSVRNDSAYPFTGEETVRIRVCGACVVVVPDRRGSLASTVTEILEEEGLIHD